MAPKEVLLEVVRIEATRYIHAIMRWKQSAVARFRDTPKVLASPIRIEEGGNWHAGKALCILRTEHTV